MTWGIIAVGDAVLVLLGVVIAYVGGYRGGPPEPVIGFPVAVLAPAAFTAFLLWAESWSLVRLGVSDSGVSLEFPKRKFQVPWYELQPPKMRQSKSGYYFEFPWKDSLGRVRTFSPDRVSAKYILDHPACPKWKLPEKLLKELDREQGIPSTEVKVHFSG